MKKQAKSLTKAAFVHYQYNLFLDDMRNPNHFVPGKNETWAMLCIGEKSTILRWAQSYQDFVTIITNYGLPKIVSFDNDLGGGEGFDGIDCAKWLFNYCVNNNLEMPERNVHSMNPIAAKEISMIVHHDWVAYKSQN